MADNTTIVESSMDREMAEFNELMIQAAKLPAEKRNIVAIYTQGVLAMANMTLQSEPKKTA